MTNDLAFNLPGKGSEDALHGGDFEWVSADPEANVLHFGPSGATLRCPEGDTTMRLEEDESAEGYYCPRHNVLMEKVDHSFGRFDLKFGLHEDRQ